MFENLVRRKGVLWLCLNKEQNVRLGTAVQLHLLLNRLDVNQTSGESDIDVVIGTVKVHTSF